MLKLPERTQKPRQSGLSVLIDNGAPLGQFTDVIESTAAYVDFVKFGWGTAVVTPLIREKISVLNNNNVHFFFGGTLFEKALLQDELDAFVAFHRDHGATHMEVSNGTIDINNSRKAEFIKRFSGEFTILSEVGYKDSQRSIELNPSRWIEFIEEDLAAGSRFVITESRESGRSGICRDNGEVRYGLVTEIVRAIDDVDRLIFEAPNKDLQVYFIKELGSNVNLANIALQDVIALETLRCGLRSDTLQLFD